MSSIPETNGRFSAAEYQRASLAAGQECLEAALEYLRLGWSVSAVCPPDHMGVGPKHAKDCHSPGKAPWGPWKEFQDRRPTESELRKKWKDNPTLNVGIFLGPVSGLVRVDVDGPGGEEMLRQKNGGDLPDTLEFTSGRENGGRGLLYRIPAGIELKTTRDTGDKKEELRFQAKGSQTVLPPSRHLSGSRYAWKPGRGPREIEAAEAPAWLLRELKPSRHTTSRTTPSANGEKLYEGSRNSTLTSLAGTLRRRGLSEGQMEAALLVANQERCEPPLDDDEVRKIARSVGRYEPGPLGRPTGSQVILAYWMDVYHPVFRRGPFIFSGHEGREVKASEACQGAPTRLIERLAGAQDAPTQGDGTADRSKLPSFFKKWAPVAWADLIDALPEEEKAAEVCEAAKEEFQARLADCLNSMMTFGEWDKSTKQPKQERRSLLDWCCKWARAMAWGSIRSLKLWTKRGENGRLQIALRCELFGQTSQRKITQGQLAALAELYDLGSRSKVGGQRVIELNAAFVADLVGDEFGRSPPKNGSVQNSAQAEIEGSHYVP